MVACNEQKKAEQDGDKKSFEVFTGTRDPLKWPFPRHSIWIMLIESNAKYLHATAHPSSVVGTHWFQWWDQPSTGRYDGENYNIGFVNVTDVPYKKLFEAAKVTHHRIKDIHLGVIKPTSKEVKVQ